MRVGSVLTVLRSMCTTATQDGLLTRNPTAGIKVRGQRAREMTILSRRVGHTDTKTTLRYCHVDPAKRASVLTALKTAKAV